MEVRYNAVASLVALHAVFSSKELCQFRN